MNTDRISLYALLIFPLPVILALMINGLKLTRYKTFAQMVAYAPHFISTVVVCQIITIFFGRSNGIINNIAEMPGHERVAHLEVAKFLLYFVIRVSAFYCLADLDWTWYNGY